MARIKLGLHVADMRGRVGQLIYSIWKSGVNYIRAAAQVVKNPHSVRQSDVRECFSRSSKYWMERLTPEQRTCWDEWATKKPRAAPMQGGSRILIKRNGGTFTGKNALVMTNIILHSAGLPEVTDAPWSARPPSSPTDIAGTFDGTKFILTFTPPEFYKPGAKVRVFCRPERGKLFHRQQSGTGLAASGRAEATSVRSTDGGEIIDSMPKNRFVWFQLDTVDPDGTTSESSNTILVKVP